MPRKKSFEEVKQSIEASCNDGTILLSEEYNGRKSPLLFKCSCGRTFIRTYDKFISGAHNCPECRKKTLAQRYRFSLEDVKRLISESGCEYLDGEYKNNQSVLTIRCSCGAVFKKKFLKFRDGQNRCPKCGSENYKGINSHFYKDGGSSAYDAIRESLLKWKDDVRKAYNDTCPITGEHGEFCDVHHIIPLKSIYEPIAKEYGVKITTKTKISDLPSYGVLDEIRKRVIEAHSIDYGILISKKIHNEYHALYRYKKCTKENFADFLKARYNTELAKIRK